MTTLLQIYEARVRDGSLTADDAQLEALPEFERIRAALAQPVKRGLFRKWNLREWRRQRKLRKSRR